MTVLLTEWRDEARRALFDRHRTLSYAKISEGTGLSVAWLKAFGLGRIEDPSVNAVETLVKFLKSYKA